MMDIKKLDADVISKIRSSFTISSVGQCVFELVCNSLDAKSTAIAVRVNLITFKIQVADNGEGITKENMALLGVRYATNKCQGLKDLARNLKTYGFRGEAIASIVEMSKCVSITSRSKQSLETYDKTLSKNFIGDIALAKHRPSTGTTVTVLGWLSTAPVRQKRIVPEIELEEVKKQLERLIIINPGTSFTLRNDITGLLLLNSPKNVDILSCFRHLHPEINDSFTLLKVSKKKLSIQMLIHRELFLSNKYQYVYVNKRPVRSTKIVNHVHSRFCRKNVNTKNNMLHSTKRYPVYVMNIKCPQYCVDNLMGPPKTEIEFTCWDLVMACIDKLIKTLVRPEENKTETAQQTLEEKLSFGVSQLNRVVQASAFKRKSSSTDDDVSFSKQKRLEEDCVDIQLTPKKKYKGKHAKGWLDKASVIKKSQSTGNYQIEDSGKQERPKKPAKIKSVMKKPLDIKVRPKSFEREHKMDVDIVDNDENLQKKAETEFYGRDLTKQNHIFDQRSVYSRLNTDEEKGKDLIMDMFLKSTQVFKNENDEIEETRADISKETIEESNVLFENNVQDTLLGINTTMSISVNVKKRRLKDINRSTSKVVHTSKFIQNTQKSGFNDFQKQSVYSSAFNAYQGDCNSQFNAQEKQIIKKTAPSIRRNTSDTAELPGPIAEAGKNDRRNPVPRFNESYSPKNDHLMIRQNNPSSTNIGYLHKRDTPPSKPSNFNDDKPVSLFNPNKKTDVTSKCVQTSQNNAWQRQKSYQTDLANRFDDFNLEHKNVENVASNYTILINTVRKQREYKFVRKSEEMEVDEDQNDKSNEFKPLKICNCDRDEKMFRFRDKPTTEHAKFGNDGKNQFEPLIIGNKEEGKALRLEEPHNKRANFEGLRDYQRNANMASEECLKGIKENPSGYYKNGDFIIPLNPVAKPKRVIRKRNSVNNNDISSITDKNELKKNHLIFRGLTKHRPTRTPIKSNLYYESPYFSKKPNENNDKRATYETFQPMFQSTQFSKASNNPKANFYREFAGMKYCTDLENYSERIQPKARDSNLYPESGCCLRANGKNDRRSYCCCSRNNIHCLKQLQTNENRENIIPNIDCHFPFNPEVLNKSKPQEQELYEYVNNLNIKDLKCECLKNNLEYLLQREQNKLQPCHGNIPHNHRGNICCQHQNINIHDQQRPGAHLNPPNAWQDQHMQLPPSEKQIHHMHETQYGECGFRQNQPQLFRNSQLEVINKDEQNEQNLDSTGPSWFAPEVSDENFYFEPTPSKVSNESLGAQVGKDDDKVHSPKLNCSPNIFSNEMLGTAENEIDPQGVDSASGIKLNQGGSEVNDLNTLCDLADFGLNNSKDEHLPKTGSNLEITVPSERERQNIIEKELLEIQKNNINNFFATESEQKVLNISNKEGADERSRIVVDSQNEWLRQFNENGVRFFVNKRTGMVTAMTPNLPQNKFDFDERLDFIPKGMSPVLKEHKKVDTSLSQNAKSKLHDLILQGYDSELVVIKWQNFIGDDPKAFFEEIYREKTKQFETCIPSISEHELIIPKNFVSFSSGMFGSLDVLGQVDKKFIAVRETTKDLLILFDQHAVHERIRVEKYLKEYKGIKAPYKGKLSIFLPNNDLALLKKHSVYIDSLGLGVQFFTNGLFVTDIPLCIKDKFSTEADLEELNKILNILIKDIIDFLKYTGGSSTLMPKIIQNIINLKACRGAIKFGDFLSRQQCTRLLGDLSKCALPFQCAHGRPTLTPLLKLSKVPSEIKTKKINLKKLYRTKTS